MNRPLDSEKFEFNHIENILLTHRKGAAKGGVAAPGQSQQIRLQPVADCEEIRRPLAFKISDESISPT